MSHSSHVLFNIYPVALALSMGACGGPPEMMEIPAPIPLTLGSIAPQAGVNSTAQTLRLTGTGFAAGASVTVGGQPCDSPVISDTQITCTLPPRAGTCGGQTVTVTHADQKTAVLEKAYLRFPPTINFAPTKLAFMSSGAFSAYRTADLNGDGVPDISWAEQLPKAQVQVALGKGDGSFALGQPLPSMPFATPLDMEIADLDGDGKLDIVTANRDSASYAIFIGNGDGSFKMGKNISTSPLNFGPTRVQAIDTNGDKQTDLVFGTANSPDVAVALSTGGGSFAALKLQRVAGPFDTVGGTTFVDLNGDALLDIVATVRNSGNVYVTAGMGGGGFGLPRNLGTVAAPGLEAVMATDYTGDGKLDVIVAGSALGSRSLVTIPGNGDGTLGTATSYATPTAAPLWFDTIDINQDGYKDLVTSNLVFLGQSGGGFAVISNTLFSAPPSITRFIDLNGDQLPDVVGAQQGGAGTGYYSLRVCE